MDLKQFAGKVENAASANYSIVSTEFETGDTLLEAIDNVLVSFSWMHYSMTVLYIEVHNAILGSFIHGYVQDPDGDQRIFFLNSYSGPARQIICEVYTHSC